MKSVTRSLMLALLLLPLHVMATDDKRELAREAIHADKQLVVAANMELEDSEQDGFWEVYEAYQKELDRIMQRSIALIEEFAVNIDNLSEDKAAELMDSYLEIEADALKLKQDYVGKFDKVLPAQKVLRYYQVENKIEAIVDYDLVDRIPLAHEGQ